MKKSKRIFLGTITINGTVYNRYMDKNFVIYWE
jgi:hypothetical protein